MNLLSIYGIIDSEKTWLPKHIEDPVSENPSAVNMLMSPKNCWNLKKNHFCPTFSSLWAKLCLKKSFLVRSKILELLVNTLTVNDVYCCHNWRIYCYQFKFNYLKTKDNWLLFIAFLKNTLNFEHFEKKLNFISWGGSCSEFEIGFYWLISL